MHSKQEVNYYAAWESYGCIVHVIVICIRKIPQFFRALSQHPSRVLLDPSWFSTCLLHDSEAYKSSFQLLVIGKTNAALHFCVNKIMWNIIWKRFSHSWCCDCRKWESGVEGNKDNLKLFITGHILEIKGCMCWKKR